MAACSRQGVSIRSPDDQAGATAATACQRLDGPKRVGVGLGYMQRHRVCFKLLLAQQAQGVAHTQRQHDLALVQQKTVKTRLQAKPLAGQRLR